VAQLENRDLEKLLEKMSVGEDLGHGIKEERELASK